MKTTLNILLLLAAAATQAQLPSPSGFNTAANGAVVGMADPFWQVALGDSLQPTSAFVPATVVGNCDALWFNGPAPNANWITYDQGNGCNHQGDLDLYFQRQIFLPATNGCGRPIGEVFCFQMDMNADNMVYEVLVNGVSNFLYSGSLPPLQFNGLQNTLKAQLCQGWQAGENLLTVHLKSTPIAVGFLAVAKTKPSVPADFLGRDTLLCSTDNYEIISPDETTHWFDNSFGKTKTVGKSGQYWAARLDADGCEVRDTVAVQFSAPFYVPNAFSPNGDGLNDSFAPFFAEAPPTTYLLQVFDRWGSLIFQSNHPADGWDGNRQGNPCNEGIYAYLIATGTGECTKLESGGLLLLR